MTIDDEPAANSPEDLGYQKPRPPARRARAETKKDDVMRTRGGGKRRLPVVESGEDTFTARELGVQDEGLGVTPEVLLDWEEPEEPAATPAERLEHDFAQANVRLLSFEWLHETADNARKTFRGIEELAEDIKEHGLLQPILVRPRDDAKSIRYELVFGARRLRACKLAGLPAMPCIIRDLSDREAYEIGIVENLNREDIHPLEEADGYRMLTERFGYSAEEISRRVGKPASVVRQRLRLAGLSDGAKKAFREDKISAGQAFLVARLPRPEDHDKAIKEITRHTYRDEPLSLRETSELLSREFMLRLKDSAFSREDATLLPSAGACTTCPKRTGAQRELFSDVEAKDDLCTDAKCFHAKTDAHWERRTALAKEAGDKVLSKTESKKLFGGGYSTGVGRMLSHHAPYVDLKETCWDDPKRRTFGELIKKSADEVPRALARDEDGAVHELVDKAALKKLLPKVLPAGAKPKGQRQIDTRASAAAKRARAKAEQERQAEREKLAELVRLAQSNEPLDAIGAGCNLSSQVSGEVFWRALATALTHVILADTAREICQRRAIETEAKKGVGAGMGRYRDGLEAAIATMTSADARGLVVEMAVVSGRYAVRGYDPIGSLARVYLSDARAKVARGAKKKASAKNGAGR